MDLARTRPSLASAAAQVCGAAAILLAIWLSTIVTAHTVVAEEGLWLPEQQPPWSPPPASAIVKVGGCSGTFVSPTGLVLTNHHCILEVLQYRSTVEQNYFSDGYLGLRPELELRAPRDFTVQVTLSRTDVTEQVLQGVTPRLTGAARFNQIANNRNEVLRRCEQQKNVQCRVVEHYGGQGYLLVADRVFPQARLVWAPPVAVGHFGGVEDNWQWPRHSADLALIRVYDENGKPYQPPEWLPLSPAATAENEHVFVAGFPGVTQRYRPVAEAQLAFTHFYPNAIRYLQSWLTIVNSFALDNPEVALRYAPTRVRWGNRLQNYLGMLEEGEHESILTQLTMAQNDYQQWLQAQERGDQYQQSLALLQRAITSRENHIQRQLWWSFFQELRLPAIAQHLYRLAQEANRPDDRRTRGYQVQQIPALRSQLLSLQRQFDRSVEIELLVSLLLAHEKLPENQKIGFIREFFQLDNHASESELREFVTQIYASTQLHDSDTIEALMGANLTDLRRSSDAWIQFSVTTADSRLEWDLLERELRGLEQQGNALWYRGLRQFKRAQQNRLADNANRTYRLSRGQVTAVTEGTSKTTMSSLFNLAGSAERYELPFAMHAAVAVHGAGCLANNMDELTLNFLSTADGTGGSSGSPTLNAKGELIGLVFDSTTPAILSDWLFSAERHRLIHADVRYLLWLLRYVYQANELLEELGFSETEEGCYLHGEAIIPGPTLTDAVHPDPEE
ncbi:S46 family peptidase [Aliidiomarina haloalkalitolerans]|uniref:Dipeptidyl-peptidase n=1 Tax=Aliidiomarina haloalkalitolerans TaxID=859059 RepID=A0A432VW21_9GAMM|nr:S46 family peptidase [Aliidiomarina haloalkalitolerans]RUO20651.1 hypothetical protein CWE06_04905 [Aliidiomarina haloalkalitolerans]